jgi:hypothetical protein
VVVGVVGEVARLPIEELGGFVTVGPSQVREDHGGEARS